MSKYTVVFRNGSCPRSIEADWYKQLGKFVHFFVRRTLLRASPRRWRTDSLATAGFGGRRDSGREPMTAITGRSTAHSVNVDSQVVDLAAPSLRIAIIGTYPPTRCGIATYTESLRRSLASEETDVDVVRVLQEGDEDADSPVVAGVFRPSDPGSLIQAAGVLSRYDLAILQHEFGIYGPGDGRAVVELVDTADVPTIVTVHTVTENPTRQQNEILRSLVHRAVHTVVHSEVARQILQDVYLVDRRAVTVIPHGADRRMTKETITSAVDDPVLLTWGLIGPGKGLEWAVRAVDLLKADYRGIRYVIAGQTHPKVVAAEGEVYRRRIEDLIDRLDLSGNVEMLDEYLADASLAELISRASVVVLSYESSQQTTSGVLSEGVTWGVPVVATRFPHALEMERMGAARTVPHRDPAALAGMIGRVLSDGRMAAEMRAAQARLALSSGWERVGASYRKVADEVLGSMAA